MRLWHYELIPYLPKSQLLGQWRELNSIFKKQDRHILINYIYEYPKLDLLVYSNMVIDEFRKRGYKIRSFENYQNYFNISCPIRLENIDGCIATISPFKGHHGELYLMICYHNLLEKYIRGQKDFSTDVFNKMHDFIFKERGLKF